MRTGTRANAACCRIAPARSGMSKGIRRGLLGCAAGLLAAGCDIGQEIEKPTPRFAVSPVEYPVEMWDQDVEGSTLVRILVNEEGGVDSVMVVESSGYALLDSAAAHGARAMRFTPAVRGGEPLRVWTRVPVHFMKDPPGGPADAGEPDSTDGPEEPRTAGNGS